MPNSLPQTHSSTHLPTSLPIPSPSPGGAASHLRLVRGDEDVTDVEAVSGFGRAEATVTDEAADGTFRHPVASGLLRQLQLAREENNHLREEVKHLRRRDDTVKFTMQRIDEELRLAARLQRDFMPRTLPCQGRVRFYSLFRPASYVSGDIYDVSRLDEKHLGFYMADAVGHGMPAALLTMFMKQSLQTKEIANNSYRLLRPSETLSRLNEAMVEQDLSESTFATAVCGLINIETGVTMVSAAGHPSPVLVPRTGEPSEVEVLGPLLGIFPGEAFTDITFTLSPGDRLILFTDGVEVAFPVSGAPGTNAHYDNERWRRELLSARGESSQKMLDTLSSCIDAQSGSLTPADDLTIIVVDVAE